MRVAETLPIKYGAALQRFACHRAVRTDMAGEYAVGVGGSYGGNRLVARRLADLCVEHLAVEVAAYLQTQSATFNVFTADMLILAA